MPPRRDTPWPDPVTIHATTVASDGSGILIIGASGSGKSGLAIELIARGARLVADDRTIVDRHPDRIIARPPDAIANRIEARGVGILAAPGLAEAPLRLVVDMDHLETQRLPDWHETEILGLPLPCLRKSLHSHFPAAILLYVAGCRLV